MSDWSFAVYSTPLPSVSGISVLVGLAWAATSKQREIIMRYQDQIVVAMYESPNDFVAAHQDILTPEDIEAFVTGA